MNTRNIKTVIIILLVAANIFLISSIAVLNLRVQNIPSDMIENAVAVLRAHGVEADSGKIPARRPIYWIYMGVFPGHSEIVRYFSGASDEEIANGLIQTPEGSVFNISDYRFWFADYMQIEIVMSDYIESVTAEDKEILAGYNNFSRADENRTERIIRDFLRKYSEQDIRTGFEIIGLRKDGENDRILINQTLDGLFIASHRAYIIINDGRVKYFSGQWYFGEFVDRYEVPLLDAVNILFKSLEHDGNVLDGARLESMGREYNILKLYGTDTFYFTPSWVVNFDSYRSFSYDMMTGNKNN